MAFSMVRIIEENSKKLVKTGEIHKMSDITMRIGIHTVFNNYLTISIFVISLLLIKFVVLLFILSLPIF